MDAHTMKALPAKPEAGAALKFPSAMTAASLTLALSDKRDNRCSTCTQGLTLVHFSAQRKRFRRATCVHFPVRREHLVWVSCETIMTKTSQVELRNGLLLWLQ